MSFVSKVVFFSNNKALWIKPSYKIKLNFNIKVVETSLKKHHLLLPICRKKMVGIKLLVAKKLPSYLRQLCKHTRVKNTKGPFSRVILLSCVSHACVRVKAPGAIKTC